MAANIGLGIVKGAAAIPENVERLNEAKSRRKLSDLKLQEYQQQAPARATAQEVEMQNMKNELRQSQSTGMQQMTYSAFTRYDGDGSTRHLNNFLQDAKRNPMGARMFADVVRYDEVVRNPETEAQLKRMGIEDVDGYFEDPRKAGNYVMATGADGSQKMLDMDKVYASTGYTRQMQQEQLKDLTTRSLINQRMRTGQKASSISKEERIAKKLMEELKIPFSEAYKMIQEGGKREASSALERLAKEYQEENPGTDYLDAVEAVSDLKRAGTPEEREAKRAGGDFGEEFEKIKAREDRTTSQKSFEEIEAVKDQLDTDFGGDFLSANLSDSKVRSKVGRKIVRIEKDFPISAKDAATAVEIRQLTGLAATAGEEITDAEAGPLDSMFRGVKKYISNEVTGTKGTAAYEAFRNTMKHALFGATQSKGEMQSFQKAAGSLDEQLGPVLVKFRTQIEELKTKLSAVYDMNDEYVAKYRLNMSRDEIAKVLGALDERIDMLDTTQPTKGEVLTPGKKKTVGEYFGR